MAASATAADTAALKLDSIPTVDLRLLSQSELYSLSLCSSAAFDPCRCDDVVIPKIDRSVFNESAGSRKQTYSRLRLAPPSSFSSSSSATPRRRAPQLRSAAAAFPKIHTDNSDPENAENSRIVALLKQLFVADLNPEELVPVKIDYSDSLPSERFSSLPTSSTLSERPADHKRKRGRSRLNEILGNRRELAPAASVVDVASNAGEFSLPNDVVVRVNMEDRDREILNMDGVAVDLVALGAIPHPYQEEIRRMTEGLTTEEQLFEFLRGLNGEWSNKRMTKRVVDAKIFGSALPVGWNLSLSIAKENDQFWLYCRRYISPSGLHFVSCKGVSSYLLSLHGIQDTSIPYSSQHNVIGGDDKLILGTIPDIAVEDEHRKENIVFQTSSPAIDSTSGNHETHAVKTPIDSPKDRIEPLHCSKCKMTFSGEDELLQHQSSHQRKRSRNDMRISDGVIVKDGKYECQFCHKTFSERHRYNGHVGTHVRNQAKIAGESQAGKLGESVDPCSVGEFPLQDTVMKGKLDSDNSAEKICISINNGENLCSLDNKNNANIGDMKGVGDATDIRETTPYIVDDVHFSSQNNRSSLEEAKVKDCAAQNIDDDFTFEQNRYENGSPLPADDDATHGLHNVHVIENTHWTQNPDERMVSKSSLVDSNRHVEECGGVVNNKCISQSRNDANLDSENLPVNKSIFNFFETYGENTSISGSIASKLNDVSDVNTLPTSQVEKACSKDDDPCLTDKYEVDETFSVGIWEKDYENSVAVRSKNDEVLFGFNSVIPSWNGQEQEMKKYGTTMPNCLLNGPGVQSIDENKLISLSGHKSIHDIKHNDAAVGESKVEASEFDKFRTFEDSESTDSFRSDRIGLNFNSIMGSQQDMKLGLSSALPSATDGPFFLEDNGMRILNGTFTEQKQEQRRGVLQLNRSGYSPANHSKLDRVENSGKHELSLSINDLQTELRPDSFSDEQKRYLTDSFNIQSVHKTYGDQMLLSTRHSNQPDSLKQGKAVRIGIPDSPFSIKTHELISNFGTAHPGDQIGTSGQNFMAAFGNGGSHSGNCGTAGSWRTGHENVFQGTFIAAMNPQIPPSNCYGTFDLTSNKGEEGSFQVNKNYNFQSDSLRPAARTGPVERRFFMEESSNSVPQESRIFPYTDNVEQGLDPSFWFGKDTSMPNASLSNQASSICIWCRNMFYHEANEFDTQTGTIGAMCPSCSSKFPGPFNAQ